MSFAPGSNSVLEQFDMPPSAAFLGYEFMELDRDAQTMRVHFQARKEMLNPKGTIQGGFLTAMLDDVMGSMVVALTSKGSVSTDIHTQYLLPVFPGPLIGEARVVHMARATVFTQAALYNDTGEKVAAATQTARMVKIPGVGDD